MIGHGVLEPWEKELRDELMQKYEGGNYLDMLVGYCHEGLLLGESGCECTADICSEQGRGNMPNDAIKDLADKVYINVRDKDMLGC